MSRSDICILIAVQTMYSFLLVRIMPLMQSTVIVSVQGCAGPEDLTMQMPCMPVWPISMSSMVTPEPVTRDLDWPARR